VSTCTFQEFFHAIAMRLPDAIEAGTHRSVLDTATIDALEEASPEFALAK
jgi:hypothetical protein